MSVAHTCPYQHLLSGRNSNMASWFVDHEWGAWPCTVQGSNAVVPVRLFLYSGPFLNVAHLTEHLQKLAHRVFQKPLKLGCSVSKVLEVKLTEKPCSWILAENQMIKVEADNSDARDVKCLLYQYINKQPNSRSHPGQYNLRFFPGKTQVVAGASASQTCVNTL